MQLVRWSPFRELERMEKQLNGMFEEGLQPWQVSWPTTDMYEEDGKLVVSINLPGFTESEIETTISGSTLQVRADHTQTSEKKTRRYITRESSSDSFWRHITLPETADSSKTTASFTDGVLTVTMPTVPHEAKKIPIVSKQAEDKAALP